MKKLIIIIFFLMQLPDVNCQLSVKATPDTDSLEKMIIENINKNKVQSGTLHQLYELITELTYLNPVKALNYCFKLEFYSKKMNLPRYEAAAYNKTGLILFNQNLLEDALINYKISYNKYSIIKDSNAIGYTLNDIGNIYYYQSKNDSAEDKYREAISIFSKIKNYGGLALSYNNLGFLNNYRREYGQAISNLHKALEFRKLLKNTELTAHSYEFIGTFYTVHKQYDSAEYYYKNASDILLKLESSIHVFECLGSYTEMYIQKGADIKKVLSLLDNYEIPKKIKEFPQGVNIYYEIGKSYKNNNKFKEAVYFLNLSVELSKKYKDDIVLKDSYYLLSDIYSKFKNYPLALDYYKYYNQLNEEINNSSKAKTMKDMVLRNASFEKDNELTNLKKKEEYDRKILIILSVFFGILVIGVIAIIKYSRDKAKLSSLLNNVINSLSHPFVLINVDNFEVVMANKAALSSDIKSVKKVVSEKCFSSICNLEHSCDHYGMGCPIIEVQKTLKPYTTEHQYNDINNKPIYREIHAFPLFNKSGKLTMIIEYMFDITSRKNLEEEIKKFFVAVERAPSDIVITNYKGLIEYVNPNFEYTTGYPINEVKGKNPRILKSGKMPKEFIKNLWDTILSGNNWSGDFINKKKDGTYYWESARIAPIKGLNDEITHFIKVGEDVTARKEAEEALRKIEHELREANTLQDKLYTEIEAEKAKTDKLMLHILPLSIAERLKAGEETIADHFDEASVLFLDLSGFTKFSAENSPEIVVGILNEIFTKIDKISEKYDIEKIKTIGDGYMAASGIPVPKPDHANALVIMSLEIKEMMKNYTSFYGHKFNIRIGLHSGPVAAGVIGQQKFIYDLWGDTVNTASRMQSSGINGKIQCSEEFKNKCTISNFELTIVDGENQISKKMDIKFIERGSIEIKGKGKMKTYFIEADTLT